MDIAIPTSTIAVNADGRPVLNFYAQISSQTFLSADVVAMAVQVRTACMNSMGLCCVTQLL